MEKNYFIELVLLGNLSLLVAQKLRVLWTLTDERWRNPCLVV